MLTLPALNRIIITRLVYQVNSSLASADNGRITLVKESAEAILAILMNVFGLTKERFAIRH